MQIDRVVLADLYQVSVHVMHLKIHIRAKRSCYVSTNLVYNLLKRNLLKRFDFFFYIIIINHC